MMGRNIKHVYYSYESGDRSLPHLKDMVSDNEDPHKKEIIEYLRGGNLITVSPGIIYDEINPDQSIGSGYRYSDGIYIWDDVFCNYVKKYNIPVPEEFRNHILDENNIWNIRHKDLCCVDSIEINNNPYLGYEYNFRIYKNGAVKYENLEGRKLFTVKPEDAQYFIRNHRTSDMFCYGGEVEGKPIIDGYHWKITFYKSKDILAEMEGWPGEDRWRYDTIKKIIKYAESCTSLDIGSDFMNYYKS